MCPDLPPFGESGRRPARWNDARVLIFTEYDDTKRYLAQQLAAGDRRHRPRRRADRRLPRADAAGRARGDQAGLQRRPEATPSPHPHRHRRGPRGPEPPGPLRRPLPLRRALEPGPHGAAQRPHRPQAPAQRRGLLPLLRLHPAHRGPRTPGARPQDRDDQARAGQPRRRSSRAGWPATLKPRHPPWRRRGARARDRSGRPRRRGQAGRRGGTRGRPRAPGGPQAADRRPAESSRSLAGRGSPSARTTSEPPSPPPSAARGRALEAGRRRGRGPVRLSPPSTSARADTGPTRSTPSAPPAAATSRPGSGAARPRSGRSSSRTPGLSTTASCTSTWNIVSSSGCSAGSWPRVSSTTTSRRACLAQTKDAIPRVVLLGRLCLYGPGAARLHEEIIPVTARWAEPSQAQGATGPLRSRGRGEDARPPRRRSAADRPSRGRCRHP